MAAISPVSPYRLHSTRTSPLALWHLFSLDAPTVAALWTWFIASANHLRLPAASVVAMFLAVWMLYATDRLMDARPVGIDPPHTRNNADLEARHYFHNRHRAAFVTAVLLASAALATLLPRLQPTAIHLYLILGGLVAAYFILIHATRSAHRLPKEIAVGFFFAAAIFVPTVARRPDLRIPLLPLAMLFAGLCSLNCLFIYAWEHSHPQDRHLAHVSTRIALRFLPLLTVLLILASLVFGSQIRWPIPSAIALSATLLLVLHRYRHNIARTTLRASADLALTTPLLFLPFLVR